MLEIDELGFTHDRRRWLFRDMSCRIDDGQIMTVLGPNGRGKTTLLRCLVGLATPTEGTVRVDDTIGFVPQSHRTTFAYRVLDMVLMGRTRHLRSFATPGRRDRELAFSALERVGLAHLAERDYPTLSGGERQLVMIARAIAAQSRVLVLDEPASSLDLHNQGRVLHLLRDLADEGRSVVMTTHHPDHAIEIANIVMLLFGGSDVRTGPSTELLTDETVGALYGVRAHSLNVDDGQTSRQVIVTRFDQEAFH